MNHNRLKIDSVNRRGIDERGNIVEFMRSCTRGTYNLKSMCYYRCKNSYPNNDEEYSYRIVVYDRGASQPWLGVELYDEQEFVEVIIVHSYNNTNGKEKIREILCTEFDLDFSANELKRKQRFHDYFDTG